MRIRILPSSHGNPEHEQFLTSYLIDDAVAIDAGCLGFGLEIGRQTRVRHVFLSHSHTDHICSLPIFLENFHQGKAPGDYAHPTVYASPEVLDCLRSDMFNDRVWPKLSRFATGPDPYVEFVTLSPETTVEAAGLRITPVPANHVVPTFAFIVDDGVSAVVFGSDTGPVGRLWKLAETIPHLKALFLEVTFPDELGELAGITGHLTPSLFAREAAKAGRDLPVVAVHIRAQHRERITRELHGLGLGHLILGRGGTDYDF